jgi:hypothetical protein
MNKEIKKLWRKALESKQYEQCEGKLRVNNQYDVLGVLCELYRLENGGNWIQLPNRNPLSEDIVYSYLDEETFLPVKVINWAGLQNDVVNLDWLTLAQLNDDGLSFRQLSLWIKDNIPEEDKSKQLSFV